MSMRRLARWSAAVPALMATTFASSGAFAADELSSGDTAWILTATALVLFMTLPGLAMFYGGLVRARNVLSVLMHCFAIACLASVVWLLFVYSLAFGDGGDLNPYIGGFGKAFLSGWRRAAGGGSEKTAALASEPPEHVSSLQSPAMARGGPEMLRGSGEVTESSGGAERLRGDFQANRALLSQRLRLL